MAKKLVSVPALLLAAILSLIPRPGIAQATTYETLYSFKGSPDGAGPMGALFIGSDDVLFGTTEGGGTSKYGTIFALIPNATAPWSEYVLYNFANGLDGAYPQGALAYSTTYGVFYGTTLGGAGAGSVFQLAPRSTLGDAWTETVLYSIPSTRNGQNQHANGTVFIGPGGTLFITTQGTVNNQDSIEMGTVDALAPPATSVGTWTPYVLYTLGNGALAGGPSGDWPLAGVVGYGGSLFGTTSEGGDVFCSEAPGCGTVYELTPPEASGGAWTETTLHQFTGPDGAFPAAALTVGPDGVLYGTTSFGGTGSCSVDGGVFGGCGTVFQLTPPSSPGGTWTESVLYNFTSLNGDGAFPMAVVVGKNGTLDGTTESGGNLVATCPQPVGRAPAGCGTVYELVTPATPGGPWTENVLHVFSGQPGDGSVPTAGLALSSTGILFGTTYSGGTDDAGTVFAVAP
jgi:uncharacterized repeat protein (TIGR03803 family)